MTDARDQMVGGSGDSASARVRVGLVTRGELLALIASGEVETVVLAAPDRYGRLFGKRVHAPFFAEDPEQGMMTCSVNVAWDLGQEFVGHLDYAGWHTGYHDMHGRPDMATARVLPWADKTALILCDLVEEDGADIAIAPRTMLRRQLARAAEAGFVCKTASELEFHVFRETYDEARAKGYRDLTPAPGYCNDYMILAQAQVEPFLGDVRRALTAVGVPVECSKGEWGWGQTEVNLRYADALESADRHVLYKEGVKELAQRHGLSATFMALPFAGTAASSQPPSGSSCHIHLSLWGADGAANLFAGAEAGGEAEAEGGAEADGEADATLRRHFLGGLMHCIPDLMPLYAPSVNSYKRLRLEDFSPCANAWGYDNRSVAFRIVGQGDAARIENRVPGADVNPYLAYAAMIGSGLFGIEQGLEPGPFAADNARTMPGVELLPRTLAEALARFRDSELAKEILTAEVVQYCATFLEHELEAYESAVTDWERAGCYEQA
jgi:glutamine synthetase